MLPETLDNQSTGPLLSTKSLSNNSMFQTLSMFFLLWAVIQPNFLHMVSPKIHRNWSLIILQLAIIWALFAISLHANFSTGIGEFDVRLVDYYALVLTSPHTSFAFCIALLQWTWDYELSPAFSILFPCFEYVQCLVNFGFVRTRKTWMEWAWSWLGICL